MTTLDPSYSSGHSNFLMPIPMVPGLPAKVVVQGQIYRASPELHCTLVSTKRAVSQLEERDSLPHKVAQSRVQDVVTAAINRVKPKFHGYLNELRLAHNLSAGKRSIVLMAQMDGLDAVFDEINQQLKLGQPTQPAHVTLFMEGNDFPFGVALNSQNDIDQFTVPLDDATRSELTRQINPYATFSWSQFMKPEPVRNNLILELHVPSFAPVREFYGKFGFSEVDYDPISGGGQSDLGYFEIKREDDLGRTQLNFYGDKDSVSGHAHFNHFPPDTPRGYGVEVTIPVSDVIMLWNEVGSQLPASSISEALVIKRWGKRDFRVVDPYGFYVRFTEPVDWNQDK
jgi:hypothetical protein